MCEKKVLFLAANPKNFAQLSFGEEKRAIEESVKINVEPWLNQNDLIHVLRDAINTPNPPNIIHFSGHGETEGIYLENISRLEHLLNNDDLISLFKELKGKVECVIFNSCKSGYQASILSNYINFVIGFSNNVSDNDSIGFSRAFYQQIAKGNDFKTAASSAFNSLSSRNNGIFYYKGVPGGPSVSVDPLKRLQEFIQIRYINPEYHFNNGTIDDTFFNKYSRLFSFITDIKQSQNEGLMKIDSTNIIEEISNFIINNNSTYPLKVNGFSGAGKSTFLTLLYLRICKDCNYQSNAANAQIPIYIDFHYYLKRFTESNNDNPNQLQADLYEDWEYLNELMKKLSGPFIFVINGLEEYDHTGFHFDRHIKKLFDDCNSKLRKYKKIIGISTQKKDYLYWNQDKVSYEFLNEPLQTIELKSIPVSNDKFNEFIEIFCDILPHTNKNTELSNSFCEDLKRQIKEYNLHELDLFILRLLQDNRMKRSNRRFNNLSEFYISYCGNELAHNSYGEDQSRVIDEAAKLAFRCVVKNERIDFIEKKKCWFLIHSHNTFRNFLLAQYIMSTLLKINKCDSSVELIEDLNYVYPNDVNIFLKELVNRSNFTQRSIFEAIDRINNNLDLVNKGKVQLCIYYILGRFTDERIKEKAKQLLIRQKQKIAAINNVSNREDILLHRTIYISLIYLEHRPSLKEYLNKLMKDPLWENINRGFHLEYYGDIPFDINENLLNRDDLKKDFPMTYARLYSSLDKAIKGERFHTLFEIELYTLCSLAQHRHIIGKLDEEKRKGIIQITRRALTVLRERPHNVDLHQYVSMINYNLKVPKLSLNYFIKKFFKIKSLKRQGWVKRGIEFPESVAAHMYGAYLLGLMHLPNDLKDKEGYEDYDKEKILKMLLIHDLAEVSIGDLLPEQKIIRINVDKQEERWFKIVSMLDTYSAMGTTRYIFEYWFEFQKCNTINAKIAKDLDRLENLLQLYIYKNKLSRKDFNDFRDALLPLIQTDEGKNIKDIIEGNSSEMYISKNRNHLDLTL